MESRTKATPDTAFAFAFAFDFPFAFNGVGKADINLAGRIDNLVLSFGFQQCDRLLIDHNSRK